MIIAIDFDGTIVRDAFPEVGEIMPGAKEAINALKKEGYTIIIWTCRAGIDLARAVEWMAKNGIHYNQINNSCPVNVAKYGGVDTRKVYADLYIDDKGMMKPLPSWDDIYGMVREMVPTYGDKVLKQGHL